LVRCPTMSTPGSRMLRQRISYNASSRFVGRLLGALITLVALRLATHYFHPARWGVIVAASAFANLFVGVCDFGVMRIVSRELAAPESDERTIYGAGIIGVTAISLGAMVIMGASGLVL
jgi:O-antigen/teichoic acid export membrane protein